MANGESVKEGLDKSIQDLPAHAESGACPDLSFDESSTDVLDSRAGHPRPAEALI
jgi:hypothetical protein